VGMTRHQRAARVLRGKMRSPGRPPAWQRDQYLQFWAEIAKGLSSEDAAISIGVSSPLWEQVVPSGWRYASQPLGSVVGPLPVACRARGDRHPQG
jgi:hypothetical protein